MYLQSYIYRATSALNHLSESKEMQVMLQESSEDEIQVALIYGARDLKSCCSNYRGLTCTGSQGTPVGRIRNELDKLSSLCDAVALALVEEKPLESVYAGLRKCAIPAMLGEMQRCGWNDWRSALAMRVPEGYLRSLRADDLNQRFASATKCVAAYSSPEKYTLLQSYTDRKSVGFPTNADVVRTRDVHWLDMCNVDIKYRSAEPGYCEIFEEHDILGYSTAVINYWVQVAKQSLSAAPCAATAV